jgi:hypothetical protein
MADTGDLNFDSWEGDGKQTVFTISEPLTPPTEVAEGAEVYPIMTHDVDRGFRWSYDAARHALIVDGDPPAEGVIIFCRYQPKPHVPVEGEEWTTITIERGDPHHG